MIGRSSYRDIDHRDIGVSRSPLHVNRNGHSGRTVRGIGRGVTLPRDFSHTEVMTSLQDRWQRVQRLVALASDWPSSERPARLSEIEPDPDIRAEALGAISGAEQIEQLALATLPRDGDRD